MMVMEVTKSVSAPVIPHPCHSEAQPRNLEAPSPAIPNPRSQASCHSERSRGISTVHHQPLTIPTDSPNSKSFEGARGNFYKSSPAVSHLKPSSTLATKSPPTTPIHHTPPSPLQPPSPPSSPLPPPAPTPTLLPIPLPRPRHPPTPTHVIPSAAEESRPSLDSHPPYLP